MVLFWIWIIGLCVTALALGMFVDPDDIPDGNEIRLSVFWPVYLCIVIGVVIGVTISGAAQRLVRMTSGLRRGSKKAA